MVQFFIRSGTVGSEINLKYPKVEQGSIATPWMPSDNEVKTSDYPSYIGQYTDNNVESNLDYSKYQWAIFKGQNSNAYIAYSWSSDGTDRFSTVYPNLNLLDGTKDFSGTWTNSSSWVTDGTYKGLTVKKRTEQWNGIYKTFTAPKDGVYTFSSYIKSSGNNANIYRYGGVNTTSSQPIIQKQIGNNFDWTRDNVTLNLKANDSVWIRYEISGAGTDSILWTAGYKYESSSIATPWMPSESESQEQWQDAIPMYVGVGDKDSQNPSDYRWQLNSKICSS
ncbi:putative tail protein [Lactococcus phage phiL47]|uniref:Putative tail protein n=1 Tax=Lactococcus phage phiL47 TaxID=1412875 RepID=V9VDC8_9CAUD|nr:tail protein [Lactococcus phage phiL47]AHC94236.1 putative tail protein [Lactococcus phage phiL47]